MKHHIMRRYDEQLDALRKNIAMMGHLAAQQMTDAVAALSQCEPAQVDAVVSSDKTLDTHLHDVENSVIELLALRQPVADDLRLVISALRGSRDFERIGDYAKNIAKHATTLCNYPAANEVEHLTALARPIQQMLSDVVVAYAREDGDLAERVRAADVEVDRQYTEVFQSFLSEMEGGRLNPTAGAHLLFVARALERIGDHITNIAEDVIYQAKGKLPADERERGDMSPYTVGKS